MPGTFTTWLSRLNRRPVAYAENPLRACPVGPGDLVVEFGAGRGALTKPLASTGARVLAVERDPYFVRRLATLADAHRNLRLVHADARTVSLPRREFMALANPPYGVTTVLLRRLLSPRTTTLRRATMLVEWGFAKRVTAAIPRDREQAWWAARFTLTLVRRVPSSAFQPAPAVASAQLLIDRNPASGPNWDRALWTLLSYAYAKPRSPAGKVLAPVVAGRNPRRVLAAANIDASQLAGTVTPANWAALAAKLAPDRSLRWPPLPAALAARR